MSSAQFYSAYLTGYTSHLATSSWHYFAIAGGLVALGFVLFGMRQAREQDDGFLAVLLYSIRNRRARDRQHAILFEGQRREEQENDSNAKCGA